MPKPAKQRIVRDPAIAVESRSLGAKPSIHVADRDIARRAFELHCQRGFQYGHDLDDWLQAERELRDAATTAA